MKITSVPDHPFALVTVPPPGKPFPKREFPTTFARNSESICTPIDSIPIEILAGSAMIHLNLLIR